MTVIDECNRRCGANWFRFCAKSECQYFKLMLIESEARGSKMAFVTIGDRTDDKG